MGTFEVRYLIRKKQKSHNLYYWQPRQEYAPEFTFIALGRDFAQAVIKAEKLNEKLDAWRKSGVSPGATKKGTVRWLAEEYQKSDWWTKLAERTKIDYRLQIAKIITYAGDEPLAGVTRAVCKGYYNKLRKAGGISSANATLRVLKILFSFALDETWVDDNPVKGIKMATTEARQQVWTREEVDLYVLGATGEGSRSVALAVILAENIGQRQGDILALKWGQYDGDTITLRQNKTGVLINVPCTDTLKEWLDCTDRAGDSIVTCETTKKPFNSDHFKHLFATLKKGLGIDDKQFLDLRRTAVVRLAEAGCTIPEVAAITGHSIETCTRILEVYLPRNAAMARNAINKLEAHRLKQKTEASK